MNEELLKRLKSLLWRVGAVAVVGAISAVSSNLNSFDLDPRIVVLVGLLLGEVTKYLNNTFGNPQ